MLAWLCNRVMAVASLDVRAMVRAMPCITIHWHAHPRGNHCTISRPWHHNIMNGLANEGLLIDYGETEYYLPNDGSKRCWDTLSMLCFSSLFSPEGLYIDLLTSMDAMHGMKSITFYNISLSPNMCYNTEHCIIFVHASININSAN